MNSRSFDFKTGSQEHIREASISGLSQKQHCTKTYGPNIGAGWKARTQDFVMEGLRWGGGGDFIEKPPLESQPKTCGWHFQALERGGTPLSDEVPPRVEEPSGVQSDLSGPFVNSDHS